MTDEIPPRRRVTRLGHHHHFWQDFNTKVDSTQPLPPRNEKIIMAGISGQLDGRIRPTELAENVAPDSVIGGNSFARYLGAL